MSFWTKIRYPLAAIAAGVAAPFLLPAVAGSAAAAGAGEAAGAAGAAGGGGMFGNLLGSLFGSSAPTAMVGDTLASGATTGMGGGTASMFAPTMTHTALNSLTQGLPDSMITGSASSFLPAGNGVSTAGLEGFSPGALPSGTPGSLEDAYSRMISGRGDLPSSPSYGSSLSPDALYATLNGRDGFSTTTDALGRPGGSMAAIGSPLGPGQQFAKDNPLLSRYLATKLMAPGQAGAHPTQFAPPQRPQPQASGSLARDPAEMRRRRNVQPFASYL